ncbi:MAG: hypothetical protein LBS39_00585 [Campylobacteraceae bacterium]|nr:hypothetical protein [Campylobacteraceae bacterium]
MRMWESKTSEAFSACRNVFPCEAHRYKQNVSLKAHLKNSTNMPKNSHFGKYILSRF